MMSYLRTISDDINALLRDERGGMAIEYAMIASFIGIAIAAIVINIGSSVLGLFTSTGSAFTDQGF